MALLVSNGFREMMDGPEEQIDLAAAALCIARCEYPELDINEYLRRLDDLATDVRSRCTRQPSPENLLRAINSYLFGELRFSGNNDEYYDPRNSFLNEVLDRRLGIPITLSIVYLEVGWRLRLPLAGVSFPGHFLVKLEVDAGDIVLDPYAGGASLDENDLQERLTDLNPSGRHHSTDITVFLERASHREILHRLLRNLKAIYLREKEDEKALCMMEHMLCVRPGDVRELRDRGLAFARIGCFRAACDDLGRYLNEYPDASDADEVRVRLIESRQSASRLH